MVSFRAFAKQKQRQDSLRDIGDQTKEDQGPQVPVGKGVLDVGKTDLVVKSGQSLGGVVTENPVDHDLLFSLCEPGLAPEDTSGLGGAFRQPAVGKDGNDASQSTFERLQIKGESASQLDSTVGMR
jgi:hypothetical protein